MVPIPGEAAPHVRQAEGAGASCHMRRGVPALLNR
jgi:hypothetical protein